MKIIHLFGLIADNMYDVQVLTSERGRLRSRSTFRLGPASQPIGSSTTPASQLRGKLRSEQTLAPICQTLHRRAITRSRNYLR